MVFARHLKTPAEAPPPTIMILSVPIPLDMHRKLEFDALEQGLTLSQLANIILTDHINKKATQ